MSTGPSSSRSEWGPVRVSPARLLAVAGILSVFMLAAVPAAAQLRDPIEQYGVELRTLVDPLDGSSFQARSLRVSNGLGGYDSDGCAYSKGQQPRTFAVATSPRTLFSAPMADFPQVLKATQKQAITSALAAFPAPDRVADLPVSTGYEIAAAVARILGKGHYQVGELYLAGAWTVRDTLVGFLPGLQGAGDTWRKMADVDSRARQQTDDRAKTRALFDLARISHRGGFVIEREAFLDLLSTFPDAGLGAMEKRDEFRRRVAGEQRLMQLARKEFQAGLTAAEGSIADQRYYLYLVGDIDRRAGDFEAAVGALKRVVDDARTADDVVALARDILHVMTVQKREQSGAGSPAEPGGSQ